MAAYYNEFDPRAAAWLRELIRRGLIADGEVDERSIVDVSANDLHGFTQCHFFAGIGGWSHALRLAGWPDDRPVWTGSPPCQPFSAAGQQKGKDDDRHLAPHFAELVTAGRPAVLFGEQVASSAVFGKAAKRTGSAVDGKPEWAWLDDLFDRLEAARYACGASDIPAAGVGAPHIRQRTFFGAVRLADADVTEQGMVGSGSWSMDCREARHPSLGHRGGGCDGGLADAESARGWSDTGPIRSRTTTRLREAEGRDERRSSECPRNACDLGSTSGLADADGRHRGRVADGEGRIGHGAATGRQQSDSELERGGTDCGLGDTGCSASKRYTGGIPAQETGEYGARVAVDGCLSIGPEHAGSGVGQRPRPSDSPWRDADWLFCRDGKWRPVEPGTFPLAHGVPARVGRLRGYGNAIVPQVAAQFVRAFDQALRD